MTLMDHAVAFEGPVWVPSIKSTGNIQVDGTLVINGSIDENTPAFTKFVAAAGVAVKDNLTNELFAGFSDIIFNKIKEEGLDLDRITQGGKDIVKGNQLGYHIIDTNIQRLGMVRDFQTIGENLLSNTLYVTDGRVGVNTLDPSSALSIWDEEVEINISKRGQDIGYIRTPRYQTLVLGANNKNNLTLNVDGGVDVDSITVGKVFMTSAASIPNDAGESGQIVWNEVPAPGSAIGWVCLGGTRWAKFGIIE